MKDLPGKDTPAPPSSLNPIIQPPLKKLAKLTFFRLFTALPSSVTFAFAFPFPLAFPPITKAPSPGSSIFPLISGGDGVFGSSFLSAVLAESEAVPLLALSLSLITSLLNLISSLNCFFG